ncbi:hypothetical protein AA0521_1091 [Komagataeibacter intermedius NRIC 0521]|uniref:Arc-like DNA binding domain-containing protein n=2 Tax=Komagataeibacter intermedius TaxID=66229 RepID=A0ABQ0PGJ3_9PROT|nr:hypothetical protein AA0521_1091 [Komagataeibacter intermedius NRIC 0521]
MTIRPPMIHFRLPPDLKEWVEEQAARNGRSVNAELVWMIEFMRDGYQKEIATRDDELAEIKKIALEALERAKDAQKCAREK